jgi:hypothetical protein
MPHVTWVLADDKVFSTGEPLLLMDVSPARALKCRGARTPNTRIRMIMCNDQGGHTALDV